MSVWKQLLEDSKSNDHLVQFYEADERALARNVVLYLDEGLKRGEGLLVVASREHRELFIRQLNLMGSQSESAVAAGRLVLLDAEQTLGRFMVDGEPDWPRFDATVGGEARQLLARTTGGGLRAYGEMVGLLWKAKQHSAAVRLEEFWDRLLKSVGFKLFCAYPIDVFGQELQSEYGRSVLTAHTHILPCSANGDLEHAVNLALDETLGSMVTDLRVRMKAGHWPFQDILPAGEAVIFWLRENLPECADEIVTRARQHYQSEKRFRSLIENSSDAISLLDANGSVVYASASTAKVLGYGPEEIIGRDGFHLLHPDGEDARRVQQEVLEKPNSRVLAETRVRRKDGKYCWLESTSLNLLDEPDIRAIVVNYRDITARRAAEEEAQRSAEQLLRSNAELQAFAYAAAHDLKEPLRTVCTFTQLLVQRTELDSKGQELAGAIVHNVKHMSMLLDDLLAFIGVGSGEPLHAVESQAAYDQACRNVQQAVEESGAIITVDPLPAVLAIESHLVQVFQNLLSNAINYRSGKPPEIRVTAERQGEGWVISIRDNGIGIAPQYHDHIFGLFKRLRFRDVPGTGVGLAICRKIVEGMGGRIWVESECGQGSTFRFTLRHSSGSGSV